jgi:protoporphyrin/coproporphyrin ferrochelatase
MSNFDAILYVSFGGPEGMDDVIPFLENVLRGRNVPRERMLEVAHHYELFGGVSPINEQNRHIIEALKVELENNGPNLPAYWGNRNWHPLLVDTIRQMTADGVQRALAFVTSAYSSYSSCRQYRENIAAARELAGPGAPQVEKIRAFFNHPLFIEANVDQIRNAMNGLSSSAQLLFTAHSIPATMAANYQYAAQLSEAGSLIAEQLAVENWQVVYQSRSGPPTQPWLEPDVCDQLRESQAKGVTEVVLAPIGFISDHMEVIYDLDVEARKTADELGLRMVRASTAGTHPLFPSMIRELILEQTNGAEPRFSGKLGAHPGCAVDCCLPPTRS